MSAMRFYPSELDLIKEHHKDLLQQAQQERLARLARGTHPNGFTNLHRAFAWMGNRLVWLGNRLQERYGEPAQSSLNQMADCGE